MDIMFQRLKLLEMIAEDPVPVIEMLCGSQASIQMFDV